MSKPERRCAIDRISLTGIQARGFHGLHPEERALGQVFIADVTVDLRIDTTSDDLAGTVNYAEIADAVEEELAGEPCRLIETLAGRIARRCLAHAAVDRVTVTVHKPQAPLSQRFADVAVTISRSRHE